MHIFILAISLVWTAASLSRSRHIRLAASNFKASRISKRYEFPSQVARIAALAFTVAAAVRGDSQQWFNVALIACAVLFGLTRLAHNLQWRHIALHQANFLIAASLLMFVAGEILPMMEIHSSYRPADLAVASMAFLVAACLIALWTPREWAPPAISFELTQRPVDAGPAPEEICSWWTKYLSYGFLTTLVWKGMY